MRILPLVAIAAAVAGPAAAKTVNWIDWQSGATTGGVFTATGQITSGDQTIDVTYTNPQGVAFFQTGAGINYWGSPTATGVSSPYTSTGTFGNDNAPPASELIALQFAGSQTLTFSQSVSNLYFAFMSINGNGYGFDQEFDILSYTGANLDGEAVDGRGYWGSGGVEKVDNGDGTYSLNATGGEPHGTIFFEDAFTSLTWESLTNEFWNGFTIGVEGTTRQVDPTTPIPLPAAAWLLAGGLFGLGALRRRG